MISFGGGWRSAFIDSSVSFLFLFYFNTIFSSIQVAAVHKCSNYLVERSFAITDVEKGIEWEISKFGQTQKMWLTNRLSRIVEKNSKIVKRFLI